MALAAAFQELNEHCQVLRNSVFELRLTAVEDRPQQGEIVLVDRCGDAAEDLLGWSEEALAATVEGCQAATTAPVDLDRARRALATAQDRFNRIGRKFWSELSSYQEMSELTRFGRARRGEWLGWVKSVRKALERCQPPIHGVSQALFLCWQEIGERAGLTSVAVQSTNIGQQITVREDSPMIREGFP
jgi:hypothetical protein